MASFLKNTGDIILDAVLTDEGRRRLAMGDGSFKITKFALGDDEINYSLWNKTASSGLEDLDIMRTPVFEAYTNNASSMKNKLMTMAANNILFMPVLKLNTIDKTDAVKLYATYNSVVIPVYGASELNYLTGSVIGASTLTSEGKTKLSIHQGIDSSYSSDKKRTMVQEGFGQLVENEYNIMVDSRLVYVSEAANGPLSIDDDYMATYSFSLNDGVVSPLTPFAGGGADTSPILGSRGTKLEFKVLPQNNLANSGGLLFSKLGSVISSGFDTDNPSHSYQIIRTMVKVVGVTTGYSIEIPIILAKKQ